MEGTYLTSIEAADYLRVKMNTHANWRAQEKGPPYVKLGGRILYRRSDLEGLLNGASSKRDQQDGAGIENCPTRHDDEFSTFLSKLPRRAQTVLRSAGIAGFCQLTNLDAKALRRIPNCGERTIQRILSEVRRYSSI